MHDHVEFIYQKIRSKALIQYFSPFSSIDLNTMASAFNTNVAGLEKELSKLIMEDSISARIDSHNKVNYFSLFWKKIFPFFFKKHHSYLEIVCKENRSTQCHF